MPFRGETVGIDALSQTLFGKAAQGLNDQDAAIAAALVRGPNAAAIEVARRACGVLRLSETNAPATVCEGLEQSVDQALQRKAFEPSVGFAPQAARYAIAQGREFAHTLSTSINTTIDASLQRFAVHSLHSHLRELRKRHVEDGGVVVLDNQTGEILAWVGSSGALSKAPNVDTVLALRQPGSTLKPFLYGQAIAENRITAASLLDDSSAQLQTGAGLYIPQNYDHTFKGWVSARTALAASLNLPAVRVLMMVTPEAFAQQLKRVGLPLKQSGDYYGYSLALGSAEVSLLNLSNAYRTLANAGRYTPLSPLTAPAFSKPSKKETAQVSLETQALDPHAAFIVGDILSDPYARESTFGTDSVLTTRFWSAVKTGTSKDMRDNWALGYSEHYTVGVWVGNANGTPMWDVSGTSGAAPVWAEVMSYLHREKSSVPPLAPSSVIKQTVDWTDTMGKNLEAQREEWFIKGTEQIHFVLNQAKGSQPRITSPTQGTILALDPDIPPKAQRLTFKAEHVGENQTLAWTLNGKTLAQGATATWLPSPGVHQITLTDGQGAKLDSVKLEVRGAAVVDASSRP